MYLENFDEIGWFFCGGGEELGGVFQGLIT